MFWGGSCTKLEVNQVGGEGASDAPKKGRLCSRVCCQVDFVQASCKNMEVQKYAG